MADLDNAIEKINIAAERTTLSFEFVDDVSTGGVDESFTNPNNNETVPSLQKQIKDLYDVDGSSLALYAGQAEDARDEAVAAKDAAVVAQVASEDAFAAVEVASNEAQTARYESQSAQLASETARDESVVAKGSSETAQSESEDARDEAVTAQNASQQASQESMSAQSAAEDAQSGSEAARDESVAAQEISETARDESVAARDDVFDRTASYEVESTDYLINTFDGSLLSVGDVVKTLGYSEKGGLGAGIWVKTSASDSASLSPSDMLTGSLTDLYGSVYSLSMSDSTLSPEVFGAVSSQSIDSSGPMQSYANHTNTISVNNDYALSSYISLNISHVISGNGSIFIQCPDADEETIVGFSVSDNSDGSDRDAIGGIYGVELVRSVNTGGIGVYVSGDFSKKQKYVMDQVNIRGNSASSSSPYYFHHGAVFEEMKAVDILGGKVNGNVDTTTDPESQVKTYGYTSKGNAGNHVYDRVLVSSVHTGISGGEGVEGLRVTSSNITNVVVGINLDSETQEPGGWIEETHINAVETGITAKNRSGIHAVGCEIFRSNDYFETGDWVGINLDTVSQSNFDDLTFKPQTIDGTGSRTNIVIKDCEAINFDQVYSRGENSISSLGGNSFCNFHSFIFAVNSGLSVNLDDSDSNITIGEHFFTIGNRGYGYIPSNPTIKIDTRNGNLGYISGELSIDGAGTYDFYPENYSLVNRFYFYSSSATSFTRNFDIAIDAGNIRGDNFIAVCRLEPDNATIRFRSGDGGDLITFISSDTVESTTAMRFVFDGDSWILIEKSQL